MMDKSVNMTNNNSSSHYNCFVFSSSLIDTIDSVVCSLVAVFGIIGNLFSIGVFCQTTKLRRLSSTVYLISLAISDTLFLFTLLLSTLALSLLKRSLFCKSIFYLMNVSGVFSSWLVVLFTVERFLVVMYPFSKMGKCSRRRARWLVFILLPIPCLMYIYTASSLIDVDPISGTCYWNKEHVFSVAVIHSIEIWLTYFLPAIAIVTLNLRIGFKLIHAHARRQLMVDGGDVEEETRPAVKRRISSGISRSRSSKASMMSRLSMGRLSITNVLIQPNAGELAATRTLIVISTAFAILNLPHNLVLLAKLLVHLSHGMDSLCFSRGIFMDTITSICNALYYANFAVNIILYHLSSTNYRRGARQLIRRICRRLSHVCTGGYTDQPTIERHYGTNFDSRMCTRKRFHKQHDDEEESKGSPSRGDYTPRSCRLAVNGALQVAQERPKGMLLLSTIPEADGALTDPRSNQQRTTD